MKSIEDLAAGIERLVRDHIAEMQRSTAAALERAFASSNKPTKAAPQQVRRCTLSKRRDPEEVAALAERLHEAVCAAPGETMAVLAEQIGATTNDLNRPMNNLRRQGRLRSVGTRNRTRYFPATARGTSARAG
jgi:hypothetical protein